MTYCSSPAPTATPSPITGSPVGVIVGPVVAILLVTIVVLILLFLLAVVVFMKRRRSRAKYDLREEKR